MGVCWGAGGTGKRPRAGGWLGLRGMSRRKVLCDFDFGDNDQRRRAHVRLGRAENLGWALGIPTAGSGAHEVAKGACGGLLQLAL